MFRTARMFGSHWICVQECLSIHPRRIPYIQHGGCISVLHHTMFERQRLAVRAEGLHGVTTKTITGSLRLLLLLTDRIAIFKMSYLLMTQVS